MSGYNNNRKNCRVSTETLYIRNDRVWDSFANEVAIYRGTTAGFYALFFQLLSLVTILPTVNGTVKNGSQVDS